MRKSKRRQVLVLLVLAACLLTVFTLIAPKVWERLNVEIVEGRSPGWKGGGVYVPGRACRYTVKKWGPLAGKPHGKVVSWHKNGHVASRAFNVNGKNHGIVWLRDESGNLVYQQRWVHGDCVETRVAQPWFTKEETAEANPRMWVPDPPPF